MRSINRTDRYPNDYRSQPLPRKPSAFAEAVVVFAVSVFSSLLAREIRHQAPKIAATLKWVPAIAITIWIFRRIFGGSTRYQDDYHRPYHQHYPIHTNNQYPPQTPVVVVQVQHQPPHNPPFAPLYQPTAPFGSNPPPNNPQLDQH